MQLLVLGGTGWLSGHVAQAALERGHDVTCLARGASRAAPAGAVLVRADRDDPAAYAEVAGRRWDAVVDVARQPGQVRRAVAALAPVAGTFVYVSSGSVYADDATPGADESASVLRPLEGDVMESMETYGEAKVACEQHVLAGFDGRCVLARAGLIGGPGDATGRSGYWPRRFARPASDDGAVLVPGVPDLSTQLIDVRDLAAWLVRCAEERTTGVYDVVGEAIPLPEHLEVARTVAGHDGPLVSVDQAWLQAHGVEPWMGARSLALWMPLPEYAGFAARSGAAARGAGLVTRPLDETLADVLAWELAECPQWPHGAGLTDAEERELLAAARSAAV